MRVLVPVAYRVCVFPFVMVCVYGEPILKALHEVFEGTVFVKFVSCSVSLFVTAKSMTTGGFTRLHEPQKIKPFVLW